MIVPCRNERKYIAAFLDCLAGLNQAGLLIDVIVADGMSIDGTREILLAHAATHPFFSVIENLQGIVSCGLNQAIRQAQGDFIVRMDVHTEYAPDYVAQCVKTAIDTGAENVGGPARTIASTYIQRAIAAGFHSAFGTGGASFRNQSYRGPTDTVPYGCWRKDFLLRIGLFDEILVRNQDDELNLRIRRAGGTVWQNPAIVSYYRSRSSFRALFRQYFEYGFWKVAVLRKHRTAASWRQFAPAIALAVGCFCSSLHAVAFCLRMPRLQNVGTSCFGTLLAAYVLLGAASSIMAAKRHGWSLLPVLPLVFATYQISYALGFWSGFLQGKRSVGIRPVEAR